MGEMYSCLITGESIRESIWLSGEGKVHSGNTTAEQWNVYSEVCHKNDRLAFIRAGQFYIIRSSVLS